MAEVNKDMCATCGREKPASELRFKMVKSENGEVEWIRMCKECRDKVNT